MCSPLFIRPGGPRCKFGLPSIDCPKPPPPPGPPGNCNEFPKFGGGSCDGNGLPRVLTLIGVALGLGLVLLFSFSVVGLLLLAC